MNRRFVLAILCAAASVAPLSAQEVTHSVSFPKGDAMWSVLMAPRKKPSGGEASPAAVTRIDIVRSGNLRRDTITYSDGTQKQQWWGNAPEVLLSESDGGRVRAIPGGYAEEQRYDEASFAWVGEATLVGPETMGGKNCLRYERKVVPDEDVSKTFVAWIDPATHRPVALNNGFVTVTFAFSDVPPESLQLPQKFRDKLDRYQAFYAPAKGSAR